MLLHTHAGKPFVLCLFSFVIVSDILYLASVCIFAYVSLTKKRHPLADPGAPPACAPQQDPILSFSHVFLPKSVRVGDWHPPNRSAPPPMGNTGSVTAFIVIFKLL